MKKKVAKEKVDPEEQIELILMELRFYGFAAVKAIVTLRNLTSGQMDCPLCGQSLKFSVASSNKHLHARCSRDGCISAME